MKLTRRIVLATASALVLAGYAAPSLAVDAALIERAKKEGEVVYYTTRVIEAMRAVSDAFQAKYGIKVTASRENNESLILKIVNEASARRPIADVFDGSTGIATLIQGGLVEPYKPQEAATFDPSTKDPNGMWTAVNSYVSGIVINTDLVKGDDVPKTIDDLLNPKWKGRKIAFTAQYTVSSIYGLIGGLEKTRGKEKTAEFLKKLRENDAVPVDQTPAGVLNQISTGQYAICIGCQNTHAEILRQKGAHVEFLNGVQPIVTFFSALGLIKGGPHPNAAKLFVEYLLSEEGQALLESQTYVTPRPNLPSSPYKNLKPESGLFTAIAVTPEMVGSDLPEWKKTYDAVMK